MALGSTQPLVKMRTRNIPGGKGGLSMRLPTSPPSRAECHEIWEPKPPGTLWATPGLLRDSFTFLPPYHHHNHQVDFRLDSRFRPPQTLTFFDVSQCLYILLVWSAYSGVCLCPVCSLGLTVFCAIGCYSCN